MNSSLLAEALKLSVPERIELAEAIWDTVATDPEAFPLSEAHKAELDRRLADLEAAPGAGSEPASSSHRESTSTAIRDLYSQIRALVARSRCEPELRGEIDGRIDQLRRFQEQEADELER